MPKNSAVIFREYDLILSEREKLAREIFAICKKYHHKFIVGKNLDLARKLRADGVHFSDNDKLPLQILNRKNFTKGFIFSFACHKLASVLKIKNLAVDVIFISPIFASKSHEGAKNLGIFNIRKIVKTTNKPIFALGGINKNNFKLLQKLGIQGFGAIEYFTK